MAKVLLFYQKGVRVVKSYPVPELFIIKSVGSGKGLTSLSKEGFRGGKVLLFYQKGCWGGKGLTFYQKGCQGRQRSYFLSKKGVGGVKGLTFY